MTKDGPTFTDTTHEFDPEGQYEIYETPCYEIHIDNSVRGLR